MHTFSPFIPMEWNVYNEFTLEMLRPREEIAAFFVVQFSRAPFHSFWAGLCRSLSHYSTNCGIFIVLSAYIFPHIYLFNETFVIVVFHDTVDTETLSHTHRHTRTHRASQSASIHSKRLESDRKSQSIKQKELCLLPFLYRCKSRAFSSHGHFILLLLLLLLMERRKNNTSRAQFVSIVHLGGLN